MSRTNSIKVLLTVNALLLAAFLWIFAVERPTAVSAFANAGSAAIPDAAAQRMEMIHELERLNASMRKLSDQFADFRKSPIRVEVTRLPSSSRNEDEKESSN